MRRVSNILVALVSAGLLLGSDPILRPQPVAQPSAAPEAPAKLAPFSLTAPFQDAAKAIRRSDFAAARRVLDPLAEGSGPTALRAHLVLGLAAHANERVALAERELRAAADPGGPFEDWRLFVLADCAAALGHNQLALSALDELVAQHATSPLLSRALLRGAQIAWEADEPAVTEAWVSRASALGVDSKLTPQLDALEWRAATKRGESDRAKQAARRLLIEAPLLASRLGVADGFRAVDGKIQWSDLLTPAELVDRASNLLAAGLEKASIETLEQVAMPDRDADWIIQMAKALTESHHGGEALDLLSSPQARAIRGRTALARLDWQRARAALEAATIRRHRRNLPEKKREALRREARHDFIRVAAESNEPELTTRALRRLFVSLTDQGLFEQSLNVLRRLRQLDPTDTTGVENLWNLGWQAFEQGNSSGAIGYWSELEDLYPHARRSRSARYWSARAYQRLGDKDQARAIFRQIATTPTNDFYRLHALEHLKGMALRQPLAPLSEEQRRDWPRDPVLARAELLSDLGLDDLALEELESERPKASPRAADALSGWILARQGRRRESMTFLSRAFPALGTPRQDELPARALELYYPLEYVSIVKRYAREEGLSSPLVMAMIRQESGFDPHARSWAGAHGLMQLMPRTARGLARSLGMRYSLGRLSDPRINIRLGTSYLAHLMRMFNDHVELALAGYNRGPYHIKRLWHRAPPNTGLDRFVEGLDADEARSYVKRILLFADSYSRLYPQLD